MTEITKIPKITDIFILQTNQSPKFYTTTFSNLTPP